jgi:membrane protein DedA with SNARE-associated domain
VRVGPLVVAAALAAYLVARWRRMSNERRVVLALAIVALAVYGSGAIHPPNLEHVLRRVGTTLGKWTYLLVGVLAFLETGAFVGLVAPGETAILVGGLVAGQGKIDVLVLIGIVWAAAVGGDVTSYLVGRRLGRAFLERHGPKVKITPDRLVQVERFFARHGGKAILLGRFIGLVRAISPFVAGASRLPFGRFLPYDVVGAGLWGTTYVLLGYLFWRSFDRLTKIAGQGALVLGTIIVLGVAVVWLRKPEHRAKVSAWLDAREGEPVVGPLVRGGRALHRRVLRPVGAVLMGPARFAWNRVTPGQLGLELTTLLAVALVAGFVFGATAAQLSDRHVLPLDSNALRIVDDLRTPVLTHIAKVVTWAGALPVVGTVVALSGAWLAMRKRPLEALALALGLALTVVAVHLTKAAVDRPRPLFALVDTDGSSYPSGHAAQAIGLVAVAFVLVRVGPGLVGRFALVVVALVLAGAVGLSRVYLRAHYLSDVVGAWALGAAVFALVGMAMLIVGFVRHNERRA